MALHDPPLDVPFIDLKTGVMTDAWQQWFIITKKDKANRVENGTEDNIATIDEDGHPQDSSTALAGENLVGTTDVQELSNKTFAELISTRIISSNGSGGFSEIDLDNWISGTGLQVTVVDDGDGKVTLSLPSPLRLPLAGDNYFSVLSDGEINLHGTARVTKNLWVGSSGLRAPGSKPASFVELGLTGVWQFGDEIEANQESVSGTLKIPDDMDRTYVPVFKIGWSADGVSPGNCEWQFEYLWIGVNEATDAAAQETLTAIGTASSTSNGLIVTSFSGIDLPDSTDQALFFKITRLSGDVADTIADTIEMRGGLFTYVSNKLGTAL